MKKNALQYGDDIDKGTCNWNGDTFSTTPGFMNGVNVVGNWDQRKNIKDPKDLSK